MNVLVACEFSGIVSEAFRVRGHNAWSCDLIPSETNRFNHHIGDALELAWRMPAGTPVWDLMIAHPPCTYLSRAGARWWKEPGRKEKADVAFSFVMSLACAPIQRIAIENPIGQINQRWRYPDQTVQPWWFGDPFTKATCLWLKNLPPLVATVICSKRTPFLPSNTGTGKRKGERSHLGIAQSRVDRSRTFHGIAEAMAEQWGSISC